MKKALILPLILTTAILAACGADKAERKTIYAMDTAAVITAYGGGAKEAVSAAESEIYRLDALMSRSNKKSDISKINAEGGGEVSDDTAAVISAALDVSRGTGGAFDITVAPVSDAWGFFGHEYRVPSDGEISRLLEGVGYGRVTLNGNNIALNGAKIDLGGVAKGYACARAAEEMEKRGTESALISFGSSIQAIGKRPDGREWRIGITDPRDTEKNIAETEISDTCIATSGSYERMFEENGVRYHHIIDPSTGYPARSGLASVSVICTDPVKADALATALFVMGLEKGMEYIEADGGTDAVFITDENEIFYTDGLEGKISILET